MKTPTTIDEIQTPALVVDKAIFDANVAQMAKEKPGRQLRPHVKAFKSTDLAKELVLAGHDTFCAATAREVEGLVQEGVGTDILLANEILDYTRLGRLVEGGADITVAVDSDEVLQAVVDAGMKRVLIDVEVGLPRCGCDVSDAGRLADAARAAGLEVRGVMGYEGHLMMVADEEKRAERVGESMALLLQAHEAVGGDIVSGGGTGTYRVNTWTNEIQAGSYCLMDTQYASLEIPFKVALNVLGRIISVNKKGWAVSDTGLKSMAMDHGNPSWPEGKVLFCSDEHATLSTEDGSALPAVGDIVRLEPAHVDPTIAKHQQMWVLDGEKVIDKWRVDLRHW